jgi:hypothetical protein
MMFGSSCVILIRSILRLSPHVDIFITGSTRFFLRNLVNRLMIDLLDLIRLLAAYVHVTLLLISIMNALNNCYMPLIILFWA